MKKVALGLSGGVDSAVAGALLMEQGYDVTGVFIICYSGPGCRSDADRKDALDVALKLGIPFEVIDYRKEYQEKVLSYFKSEYEAGRTPNPDVLCNKEIKFGLFYDWAIEQKGFDYIATGHYARIDDTRLLRAADEKKDQSYFLYQVRQEQLAHILFPIGDMTKQEVRERAVELKLPVATKPDSQGICFVGEVSVPQFLKIMGVEEKAGNVVDSSGTVIGTHKGAWFLTVGQRHGFAVETHRPDSEALYVVGKDTAKNEIVVGVREEAMKYSFEVRNVDFVNEESQFTIHNSRDLTVRIRHGGRLIPAEVNIRNSKGKVILEQPEFGVASGQAAVFYEGEELVGGGVIV